MKLDQSKTLLPTSGKLTCWILQQINRTNTVKTCLWRCNKQRKQRSDRLIDSCLCGAQIETIRWEVKSDEAVQSQFFGILVKTGS